jgi:hypothetical protein
MTTAPQSARLTVSDRVARRETAARGQPGRDPFVDGGVLLRRETRLAAAGIGRKLIGQETPALRHEEARPRRQRLWESTAV